MITTLTGSNALELKAHLKQMVDGFVAEHGDLAVERLDGEDLDKGRLQDALQTLPFLAARKLVIIRELSKNKALANGIDKLLADVPDSIEVILHEPKLDKRGSYYKTLKKLTDFKEFTEMDANHLVGWLTERARAAGGALTAADARYLIDRVGPNQLLLANELDKLLAYNSKVTRANIELLSEPTPQSTVFQLLEAAFAGNGKRTLELYRDQRRQRVEPAAIMGMIAWQLHVLAVVKAAGDREADEIAKDAALNPFVVRKTMGIARRLSFEQIKRYVAEATELDGRLKSQPIDADEAMENYLLILTQAN